MNKHVLALVNAGCDVSLGRVCISHIRGAIHRIQVFSDDYRFKYSQVYNLDDMELAVDKFIAITNQIKVKIKDARAAKKQCAKLQELSAV